mmetsp:Transcript_9600/g.15443  ORF Transcript_9600/g.15443 Transcript_9600/m.15443 type:complete len:116 (-) Transcript_9600:1780-2127(-)
MKAKERRGASLSRALLLLAASAFAASSASAATLPPVYDAWADGGSGNTAPIVTNSNANAEDSNRWIVKFKSVDGDTGTLRGGRIMSRKFNRLCREAVSGSINRRFRAHQPPDLTR